MKLNNTDKYLTVWIFIAMLIGFGFGWIPGFSKFDHSITFNNINIIVAIGMVMMLIPPFLKIKFNELKNAFKDWKVILVSLVLNLLIGPLLMFFLAISILNGNSETEFRTGIIIVGLARCIAMVVIWNALARGDSQYANALVAINSLFQLITFMPLTILFTQTIPGAMNIDFIVVKTSFKELAETMGIFLLLPFTIAMLIKFILYKTQKNIIKTKNIFSKIGFYALLIVIFYIFSSKATEFTNNKILPILKTILIFVIYFVIMWFLGLILSFFIKADYKKTVAIVTTGMGNNFELAIAIALSWFSLYKDVSLAATLGPLIEVPVMILFVKFNLLLEKRWNKWVKKEIDNEV